MANSREKRERYSTFGGAVKSKFTSKWEVVLVFVIVAAGVVITTIAAVKAKERSDTNAKESVNDNTEAITSLNTINAKATEITTNSSTKLSEVKTNQSPHQSLTELPTGKTPTDAARINSNQNRRLPNVNKNEEDYETLGDRIDSKFHSSNLEPITSESNERRMETMYATHDGLPGYPGPRDASLSALFRNKAELTADGAGFLIDENLKSNGPLIVNSDNQRNEENPENPVNQEMQNANQNNHEQLAKQISEEISEKYGGKPVEEANVYQSQYSLNNAPNRPNQELHRKIQQMQTMPAIDLNRDRNNQNDRRPQLILANHNQHLPLFDHIKPVNGLPLAISIPRRLPFSHQSSNHPSTQRSRNVAAGSNINPKPYPPMLPVFLSHFSADTQLQRRKRSVNTVNEPQSNQSEHQTEPSNQTNGDRGPENLYTAAASDYFKFNDDKADQKSFNYDAYPSKERRKSSSSRNARKHSAYSYFPTAASSTHQYGILGSGNFEIIRGGTFNNDEIASSDNNYIREQSNRYQSTDDYDDTGNDEITKYPTTYSDEEDFFSNNPVLGFQGYDNFQAASGDKSRTSSEDRSHSLENSSQPSQQVSVYMAQDLMATS